MNHRLTLETEAAARLRERIAAEFGEDHDLIRDMIEAETDLHRSLSIAAHELAYVIGVERGIDAIIADLTARKARHTKRRDALRDAITTGMTVAELTSLKTPCATLSMRASPPRVEITDAAALPPVYVVQPAPVPDKKAIATALKAGEAVPGAVLSNQPPSLSVRFT